MSKRNFIVTFRSGEEQIYSAEEVVEEEDYLIFHNPSNLKDELAGLAYLPEVRSWREIENEPAS